MFCYLLLIPNFHTAFQGKLRPGRVFRGTADGDKEEQQQLFLLAKFGGADSQPFHKNVGGGGRDPDSQLSLLGPVQPESGASITKKSAAVLPQVCHEKRVPGQDNRRSGLIYAGGGGHLSLIDPKVATPHTTPGPFEAPLKTLLQKLNPGGRHTFHWKPTFSKVTRVAPSCILLTNAPICLLL